MILFHQFFLRYKPCLVSIYFWSLIWSPTLAHLKDLSYQLQPFTHLKDFSVIISSNTKFHTPKLFSFVTAPPNLSQRKRLGFDLSNAATKIKWKAKAKYITFVACMYSPEWFKVVWKLKKQLKKNYLLSLRQLYWSWLNSIVLWRAANGTVGHQKTCQKKS